MKLSRKIQLIPRIFIKIVTNNNYYICDSCHKLHKRKGKEFDLNSKWAITVNYECSNKSINKAKNLIIDSIFQKV
jgi:hypothetical protein